MLLDDGGGGWRRGRGSVGIVLIVCVVVGVTALGVSS